MNEAQKLLQPLIIKATSKKVDAEMTYRKACDETMRTCGLLREAQAALSALEAAVDALKGEQP